MKRFGTSYGGFYYPSTLPGLNKDSIIYCVGVGEDISHDITIARQLDSHVYLFDPTPRAIQHVKYIKDVFDNKTPVVHNKRFGGGDPNYMTLLTNNKVDSSKIHMFDYGLFIMDTTLKFYKPSNPEYVSHSVVKEIVDNTDYINVPVKKLTTIMKELNHTHVDLLKIDVEGCECEVLEQMIEEKIFPKYLSIDFDLGWNGIKIRNRERCYEIMRLLLNNKYKLIHHERSDFTFQRQI